MTETTKIQQQTIPPSRVKNTYLGLADDDLRVQTYIMQFADVLVRAAMADKPRRLQRGVLALVRVIFEESRAVDVQSKRLWCELSEGDLAAKIHVSRRSVVRWLKLATDPSVSIVVPSPALDHSQKLRHRPQWDRLSSLAAAAALEGKMPGPPLFAEVPEADVPESDVADRTCDTNAQPGDKTGDRMSQVEAEPVTPCHRFASEDANFSSDLGRGVRGETPLKGFLPFTPPGETAKPVTGDKTGDRMSQVEDKTCDRKNTRQLVLDFAHRTDRRLERLVNAANETRDGLVDLEALVRQTGREILAELKKLLPVDGGQRPPMPGLPKGARTGGSVKAAKKQQPVPSYHQEVARTSESLAPAPFQATLENDKRLEEIYGSALDAMSREECDSLAGDACPSAFQRQLYHRRGRNGPMRLYLLIGMEARANQLSETLSDF